MRWMICLLSLLLMASTVWAKPKVDVRVNVDGTVRMLETGGNLSLTIGGTYVSYINVTVSSDNAAAVARNNGQWCIRSEEDIVELAKNGDYQAVLDGNFIEIEIPQTKGKPRKVSFSIFDYKWRKTFDLP